jgi:hypothetical protein
MDDNAGDSGRGDTGIGEIGEWAVYMSVPGPVDDPAAIGRRRPLLSHTGSRFT